MKQTKSSCKHCAPFVAAFLAVTLSSAVCAEELTVAALKSKGAQLLTKDDLAALLPDARLTREFDRGDLHINTLKDGSINADFQGKTRNTGQLKGTGSWKVSDDGKYCVEIRWNRAFEDVSGCRRMYKAGDDYYATASDADDAKPYRYKISK
jgi:hypothetical protein